MNAERALTSVGGGRIHPGPTDSGEMPSWANRLVLAPRDAAKPPASRSGICSTYSHPKRAAGKRPGSGRTESIACVRDTHLSPTRNDDDPRPRE